MTVLASHDKRQQEQELSRKIEDLKGGVIRAMRSRLNRCGLYFDDGDLEDFYNAAWQALYTEVASGGNVTSPEGFLVVVACRRAIDEARKVPNHDRVVALEPDQHGIEYDLDDELDRRTILRHLREGLKEKLTYREYQAATLCMVIGLTRPQAAQVLGVSRDRIERIMDDATRKLAPFLPMIANGEWCTEHESMIRAHALHLHDVDGKRYKLAQAHLESCSGCRRYVRELRGLSAFLPPVAMPAALAGAHWVALAHVHVVARTLRLKSHLFGWYSGSTKGGGAAGLGAGAGATAGPVVVGSGVGAKLAAVCAALCVASGAAILGGPATDHTARSRPPIARHRENVGPAPKSASRQGFVAATMRTAAGETHSVAPASPSQKTPTATRGHAHRAARAASSARSRRGGSSGEEFGFESVGDTPAPTGSSGEATTAHVATQSSGGSTQSTGRPSASDDGASGTPKATRSCSSSEFGFEGC